MGGGFSFAGPVASEIPLLSSFLYLLGWAERVRRMPLAGPASRCSRAKRFQFGVAVTGARLGLGLLFPPSGSGRVRGRLVRFLPSCSRRGMVALAFLRCCLVRTRAPRDPIRGHCQAGSLTGAVHLSKNNAGVLRPAQRGQKPRVEQKGKSWLDPDVQYA